MLGEHRENELEKFRSNSNNSSTTLNIAPIDRGSLIHIWTDSLKDDLFWAKFISNCNLNDIRSCIKQLEFTFHVLISHPILNSISETYTQKCNFIQLKPNQQEFDILF